MEKTFTAQVDIVINQDSNCLKGYKYPHPKSYGEVKYNFRVDENETGIKDISIYGIDQTIEFPLTLENIETGEEEEFTVSANLNMDTEGPGTLNDIKISNLDIEIKELEKDGDGSLKATANSLLIFFK